MWKNNLKKKFKSKIKNLKLKKEFVLETDASDYG